MLAAMRSAIADLLPDTCVILSITETPDGAGGVTQSWGTLSSGVSCRLDVKSGMEQVAGGALVPYKRTMLSVPYDTTITEAHRVVHSGGTYNVIAPPNTGQSWIAVKRVELERVNG
jgi:head-tail adaptor